MKTLLLLLLLPVLSHGQGAMLNYTDSEIRIKYSESIFTREPLDQGYALVTYTENGMWAYYFLNGNPQSYASGFVTQNQILVNAMVEKYNREYVRIDNQRWNLYTNGIIMRIVLNYHDDGDYYAFSYIQEQ